jgi:hypothetical protein
LAEIRSSGHATDETSYYPAIEELLREIGKRQKPRVVPILQLANRGAGQPDGGLFTQDQLRKNAIPEDFTILPPNRGAIEVKGPGENLDQTIQSEQVKKYLRAYKQVLLTNYREFRIVIPGNDGKPRALETFTLAKSEAAFWTMAAHPRKASGEVGTSLNEFLTRALLSAVAITSPDVLANFLASYAREALAKIEPRSSLKELEDVRKALEEALGLKFESELATEKENNRGKHFFRSTLVQTLFYGLFSAWVLWSREPGRRKGDQFEWKSAVWSLQVPMIRALFEQLVTPSHVRSLGLEELLSLTGEVLNRVDTAAFFQRFEEDTAVQYFYEPFLKAFDHVLRKQLGVWYTPREIVRYMVERVDTVLRTELGLPSGLADHNVYVLDPACGTGAYLVEVLDRIHRTLKEERGEDALTPHQLKQAAKERVFGFEILPAPYVIAHLQLGMYLQRANAPLTEEQPGKRERAGVYLTNALTGWEPPDKQKAHLPFQEFQQEREEADTVKRDKPILVVLGNPPYNAFAGVSPTEEDGLVEPYKGTYRVDKVNRKTGKTVKDKHGNPVRVSRCELSDSEALGGWGIKKFNLDELYVRFFRLAERRIAEKSHRGVVCFISNMSWVREPSFVVLRKHLFNAFNKVWIENLHGNRKISEYAPDGRTSETIFAVAGFSPGIKQGVATTLWVKSGASSSATVLFRDDHNAAKADDRRRMLLDSLNEEAFDSKYMNALPSVENKYSFWPQEVSVAYSEWPKITDLCAEPPSLGILENRGGALSDIDKVMLEKRMRLYHDKNVNWADYQSDTSVLAQDWARFDASETRNRSLVEGYRPEQVVRYCVRPFDMRWCYYTDLRPVWNEPRRALRAQLFEGNRFFLSRKAGVAVPEGPPFFMTSALGDQHSLRSDAYYFPLNVKQSRPEAADGHLFNAEDSVLENYSNVVREYLDSFGHELEQTATPDLWMHVLAIGYSPAYLEENADGIRQDWPRIPLPSSLEQFTTSAALGQRVAELLDTESPVSGVTAGALRPELRGVAALLRMGVNENKDEAKLDLQLTAGWGHAGKDGVTMPGRGKLVSRERTAMELSDLAQGLATLGIPQDEGLKRLGDTVVDVYLNGFCAWTNVPEKVWELYIGGYQVMKKWLSYREYSFLKRPLMLAEAEEVQAMARRLTSLCLLQPELDANYLKVKSATWQRPSAG